MTVGTAMRSVAACASLSASASSVDRKLSALVAMESRTLAPSLPARAIEEESSTSGATRSSSPSCPSACQMVSPWIWATSTARRIKRNAQLSPMRDASTSAALCPCPRRG